METVVCGGLRIDYVISATGEVRLNQIGGNAIYAAVGARTYTDQVNLVAKAGENYPQEWLDELAWQGILYSHIIRVPGWQDMRTFYAYVDEKTRIDRDPGFHFARIGQPMPQELEGYAFSTLETQNPDNPLVLRGGDVPEVRADSVHIAPMALRSHLELAQAFRQQNAGQITLDPGEYELTPKTEPAIKACCGLIDAFLPSELEVGLLLGTTDPYEAAVTFASWGVPLVLIKRGPDGCLLYQRDARKFTNVPAYPVKVVDVTGAGDTFGGAFAVALKQTGDPIRSVVMATVAASFCLEGYGALYGLDISSDEVKKRLDMLMERVQYNR